MLLQTARWLRRPEELLRACHARHGALFTLRLLGLGALVFVADAQALRELFAAGPEVLARPIDGEFAKVLGPASLLVAEGAAHRRQRRLVLPALHGAETAALGATVCRLTAAHLSQWPLGRPLRLLGRLQRLVLDAMMLLLFGSTDQDQDQDPGDEARRVVTRGRPLFEAAMELVKSPLMLVPIEHQRLLGPLSPWPRLLGHLQRYHALVQALIRRRRGADLRGRGDVLSLLLSARDAAGEGLDDREVRDQLLTLLVAGHDTTAMALGWAVHELLRRPDWAPRLRAAARPAGGDDGALHLRLLRCPLLDATVREALRLHPVFPYVPRVLARPLRLAGRALPAGTRLAPCALLVHRAPTLYPDPERFLPERFLDARPAPWEYLPFGFGPHRCAGAELAQATIKLALGTLLSRLSLRSAAARPARAAWRFFSLAPSDGLPVRLSPLPPDP